MMLKDEIKRAEETMKRAEKILAIMGLIDEHKDKDKFTYHFDSAYLRITIARLADLTKARKMLRDIFGEWTDRIINRFVSLGILYTTWVQKGHKNPIEIWYGCPIDNIDKKLQKPGCGVIVRTVKEHAYVCGLEAKHE